MSVGNIIDNVLMEINHRPFSFAYACWRKYVSKCKKYIDIEYMYGYWYHREKRSRDPIYFIFRFELPGTGIGSVANTMIFCHDWAIKNGVIPIIDLEGKGVYEKGEVGQQNVWEYCFEQSVPIKDVLKQKNVYISCLGPTLSDKETCERINGDKRDVSMHFVNRLEYYKMTKAIGDNFLKLQPHLQNNVNEYIIQNLRGFNVLGVALREEFALFPNGVNDDDLNIYNNHANVPSVEESIKIIQKCCENWKCERIFLSTLYQESIEKFKEVFGDKVVFLPRNRRKLSDEMQLIESIWSNHGTNEKVMSYYRTQEFYECTCTYIEEIYILARCSSFIGAPSSVSALAATLNGGKYYNITFFEDKNHNAKTD